MIELKSITFIQYFELEDKSEYDYAMKYAFQFNSPVDHYDIKDLTKYSFGLIKDLQYDLSHVLTWESYFEYLRKIHLRHYEKETLLKLCQAKAYIITEIERINEIEKIVFSHESTPEEEEAGMELFDDLGVYLQIRSLTGGDITKNELVRSMKYEDAFIELVTQKRLSEYQKRLNEIYKRKNKSS